MKTKLNFIFYLLFTTGIISACSSNNASINNKESAEDISVFVDSAEQAGFLHNQGLDYTLAVLQKEKRRLFKESGIQITKESASDIKDRFMNVGYDAMISFLKSTTPSASDTEIENTINRNDFVSGKLNFAEKGKEVIESSTLFVIKYYGKLHVIINDPASSFIQKIKKIKALEQEIKAKAPSVEETKILLGATILSRYSVSYWTENRKKWEALSNPITTYPNLTAEENDAVAGMFPGLYTYPSDSTKYIMLTPSGASVEQCPSGQVFYERMQTCMPVELLDSSKKLLEGNESEIKQYDKLMKSLNPAKN